MYRTSIGMGLTCLFYLLTNPLAGQNHDFPSLDNELVDIWVAAENLDLQSCSKSIESAQMLWKDIRLDLSKRPSNAKLHIEFVANLDDLMASFSSICQEGDPNIVSGHAYQLLWEFRVLRDFLEDDSYDLDILWDMFDLHEEILLTVNDDKFGLLSWSEFMKMVEEMSGLWEEYKDEYDVNAKTSHGDLAKLHQENIVKVSECLSYFEASLESAYQADFQVPCDELGAALKLTIGSHADLVESK